MDACGVGRVSAILGAKLTAVFEKTSAAGETRAAGWPEIQVGALLRMPTSRGSVYGVIQSLWIEHAHDGERRLAEIQLLGEILGDDTFARGVSVYPALGTSVLTTSREELAQIYARPRTSNVCIGTLFQDDSLPAFALTDELLGKHFAVLGTTGCGKSCSVAVILRSILDAHPHGHIVMLDPHNEYSRAFGERAEVIHPEDLELPYWLLNFEETAAIMVSAGRETFDQEVAILKSAVLEARKRYLHTNSSRVTVDTPTPYRIGDLQRYIEQNMGVLNKAETSTPFLRLKARIEALGADKRLSFMFPGHVVPDNMQAILSRLLRIPVRGKPITLLDISGLPTEIVDVAVSVICRMLFDYALWSTVDRATPILLVCEEAHRYVPQDTSTVFEPTRRAISRIAKEGRKYGISLCLVSQRPSELSASILSQCSTIFALRMSNERDHVFVRDALPEAAHGFLSVLSALRTQEAIVIGEGVSVPVRLRFANLPPDQRPRSETAPFSRLWSNDNDEDETRVAETIARWRSGQHDSNGRTAKAVVDSIMQRRAQEESNDELSS